MNDLSDRNDLASDAFAKLTDALGKHELVQGYRRYNLRTLVAKHGGQTELSKELGYSTSTYLTQMVGPTPIRGISEKNAREFEARLNLPEYSLDRPVMFSIADLEMKRQLELSEVDVDKETVDELDALGLDVSPDMAKKYSKIDYSEYRNPRYLDASQLDNREVKPLPAPSTPLTPPNAPAAQAINERTILELIDLVESSDLSSGKALKVLRMSVKDLFKKQSLDKEFIENLIELSK